MSIPRIPSFTLFPLLPYGQRVDLDRRREDTLNAYSSFTIPKTEFSPALPVNKIPDKPTFTDTSHFITIGPDYDLEAAGTPDYFQRALALSTDPNRPIQTTQPPNQAPATPRRLTDRIEFFEITDANYQKLMEQEKFRIPTIGTGLEVTTDGNGGIADVRVVNEQARYQSRVGTGDSNFPMYDSYAITTGATYKVDPITGGPAATAQTMPVPPANLNPGIAALGAQFNPLVQGNQPLGLQDLAARLLRFKQGVPGVDPAEIITRTGANPIFEKLLQLQPIEQGTVVTGTQAGIDPVAARQIATNRAKLDVEVSPQFSQNYSDLAASEYQKLKATPNPFQIVQAMDGRIPMAPSLPGAPPNPPAGEFRLSGFAQQLENALNSQDLVDKSTSGGYLFAAMDMMDMGGMNMGGGTNPGGGGDQPYPRKRLALVG